MSDQTPEQRMEAIAALATELADDLAPLSEEAMRRQLGDTDLSRYFDRILAEFKAVEARFEKIEATLYRMVDVLSAEGEEEESPLDLEGNPLPAERDPNEPL